MLAVNKLVLLCPYVHLYLPVEVTCKTNYDHLNSWTILDNRKLCWKLLKCSFKICETKSVRNGIHLAAYFDTEGYFH